MVEKCNPEERNDCKDEDTIDKWLEFKYILVCENSRRFIPHMFDDERIASYSYVKWFPVSRSVRTDIVKTIVRT